MNATTVVGGDAPAAGSASPMRASLRHAGGYFMGPGRWTRWLLAVAIGLSVIGQVAVQLRINVWQGGFSTRWSAARCLNS